MNIPSFKMSGLLLLFLLNPIVEIQAAETSAALPAECRTFAGQNSENGATVFAILSGSAQKLLAELQEFDPEFTPRSNVWERSYLWQRSTYDFELFLSTFDFLRKSECLRSDVRSLEDLLAEIEVRYQEILRKETLKQEAETRFRARIENLRAEIPRLRNCGDLPGSPYYQERYEKALCENSPDSALFQKVKEDMKVLRTKLEELFTNAKWQDILAVPGWKNVGVGTDEEAAAAAASWLAQNNTLKLLHLRPREELAESKLERAEKLDAQEKRVEEEAEKREGEGCAAALRTLDLQSAFENTTACLRKSAELWQYGKNHIYERYLLLLDTSFAEFWKEKIVAAEKSTAGQTLQVQKLTEELRRVNNGQAKNVQN